MQIIKFRYTLFDFESHIQVGPPSCTIVVLARKD